MKYVFTNSNNYITRAIIKHENTRKSNNNDIILYSAKNADVIIYSY